MNRPYKTPQENRAAEIEAIRLREPGDPRGTLDAPLPLHDMAPPPSPHAYIYTERGFVRRAEMEQA